MALTDKLTAIANAIRSKTGGTEKLSLDGMATAINGITVGGGSDDTMKGLIERNVTEVVIPNGTTKIAGFAFYYFDRLEKITIQESIVSIGNSAFSNCKALTSITIPEGVTSIKDWAFNNCQKMSEYHFKASTPPNLSGVKAFNGIPSTCIIYVPQGCLEAYQTATNWAQYADRMQEETL